jgi:hypothetical protein
VFLTVEKEVREDRIPAVKTVDAKIYPGVGQSINLRLPLNCPKHRVHFIMQEKLGSI